MAATSSNHRASRRTGTRSELGQQIIRDLAFTACFTPTEALLKHPDHRRAFEKLPANLSRLLEGNPSQAAALFSDPHVQTYILKWASCQALSRANRINVQFAPEMVAETLFQLFHFLVDGIADDKPEDQPENGAKTPRKGPKRRARPLVTLIGEGKIVTYADVAAKIEAISRGRPYRVMQDARRRIATHTPLDDINAPSVDPETATAETERQFKQILLYRAFMRVLGRQCEGLLRRMRGLASDHRDKHRMLADKINTRRAELAFQRRHFKRMGEPGLAPTPRENGGAFNSNRNEIAQKFGADSARMSAAETYARQAVVNLSRNGLGKTVAMLGLDAWAIARAHDIPDHVVRNVLVSPRPD